jgi:cytochrome c553
MAKARTRLRDLARLLIGVAGLSALIGCDTGRPVGVSVSEGPSRQAVAKLHTCAACHGEKGVSQAEIFPNLAGQQKDYIVTQLTAFRDHTRRDRDAKAYMWGLAARLDPATMQTYAAYYAEQAPARPRVGSKAEIAAGKIIYESGFADRGVLACASCHGEKGEGAAEIPRLAGQHKDYLVVQLEAFASGARDNGAMNLIAKGMSRAEITAVAIYIDSAS